MVFGDLIFTEGVTKELMASDFARNHSLGKRLGLSDVRVDLVRAPGEVFRGANQDELTDILLGIARDGFGTDIPIEEVRDNAFNCDALYLISYGDKIKGFCSYKFIEHKGQKILHLKGVVLEKEIQKEQQDMNNQNPANKNFELFINGKKVNPKNIQVTRQPIQQNYQPQKRKAINLPQNKLKKFKDLVQEEPQTEIRRLSDLIIYEIKLPGVKTDEDISIQNLAGSIEIKAISKDKAYFKTITINLPITGYSFEKENLILELEAKN
mgnify:CR=1 FL=1